MLRKIVIVGPSLKMGGMERASVNLANALHDAGQEVVYIALFNQEKFFGLNDGVIFIEPEGFNIAKLDLIATVRWLRKQLSAINPKIVLVFNKFYGAITLLSTVRKNFKILISERSSPYYQWPLKLRILNRLIFSCIKPSGIVAQTSIAAQMQYAYYNRKIPIKVIPNVLQDQPVIEIDRLPLLLAVGRLNDYLKGFDRLFRAMAQMRNTDWKLVFAGGKLEDDEGLSNLVKSLNLESRVEFLGAVSNIWPLYAQASIFIIPSRSEGFPNALAEAMAAGMACISFDFAAGPSDLIDPEKNGILVPNGDIEKLAAAIDRLIENEDFRKKLGLQAQVVKSRLSIATITSSYLEFFNEIINRNA